VIRKIVFEIIIPSLESYLKSLSHILGILGPFFPLEIYVKEQLIPITSSTVDDKF
jgi:hypothetical protein